MLNKEVYTTPLWIGRIVKGLGPSPQNDILEKLAITIFSGKTEILLINVVLMAIMCFTFIFY